MKKIRILLTTLAVALTSYASAQEPIVWDVLEEINVNDYEMQSIGPDDWNTTYAYSNHPVEVEGEITIRIDQSSKARFGLSDNPSALSFKFGLEVINGDIFLYENDLQGSMLGTAITEDILYIRLTGTLVQYFLNEDLLYTSGDPGSYDLFPLLSIYNNNGLVYDISFIPQIHWDVPSGLDPYDSDFPNDFIKTYGDDWDNTYTTSIEEVDKPGSTFTMVVDDPYNDIQFGFADPAATYSQFFEYALRVENGSLLVYEYDSYLGDLGFVNSGDRLFIRVAPEAVEYWKNDDLLYITEPNAVGRPLPSIMKLAFSIYYNSGTLRKYKYLVPPEDCRGVSAGADLSICAGGSTTLSASHPLAPSLDINVCLPVTYSWTPITGLSDPTSKTPTASPTVSTNYTVTATFPGGIIKEDDVLVTVNSYVTPTVSIVSDAPGNTQCAGQPVKFTATPGTGTAGLSPTYVWKVDAITVSSGPGNTYTTSSLTDGAQVTCVMTTSAPCATTPTATSSAITMTINAVSAQATVSISADKIMPVCLGTEVSFSANIVGDVGTATYQWKNNGVDIPAETLAVYQPYVSSALSLTCQVTISGTCMPNPIINSPVFSVSPSVISVHNRLNIVEGYPVNLNLLSYALGGRAPYTYFWTGSTEGSLGPTPGSLTPLANSSYTLTVTDSGGCTGTRTTYTLANTPIYAKVINENQDGFFNIGFNDILYFNYEEEYWVPAAAELQYSITNLDQNSVVTGLPTHRIGRGNNNISLDLSSIISSGKYLLEIRNYKQEKFYLKFQKL